MAAKNINSDREFWVQLGKEIGQNLECNKALGEQFRSFLTNDHAHLADKVGEVEDKVDKLAMRIAYIVGGITALSWVIQLITHR
jgi:hypothetical protein